MNSSPLSKIEATRAALLAQCLDNAEWVSGDGRIAPATLARLIGQKVKTLANWRSDLTGPAFFKIAGAVSYRLTDIAEWLEGQRVGR